MKWLFIFVFSIPCFAKFNIPKKMNSEDRQKALQAIGYGSLFRLSSNPYPLGGFSGFEFGLTSEYIGLEEFNDLGTKEEQNPDQLQYHRFYFGKGLYHNVDARINFSPMWAEQDLNSFGAALTWGFFQGQFTPTNISLMVHSQSSNLKNKIISNMTGMDLIGTIVVNRVSFSGFFGKVFAQGKFKGGLSSSGESITEENYTATDASGNTVYYGKDEYERISDIHWGLGATVQHKKYFAGLTLDQFSQLFVSTQIGLRY